MDLREINIKHKNNKKCFVLNHSERKVKPFKSLNVNSILKDKNKDIYEVPYTEFKHLLESKKQLNYDNFINYISRKYVIKRVNKNKKTNYNNDSFLDRFIFIKDGNYDVLLFIKYQVIVYENQDEYRKNNIYLEVFYLIKDRETKMIYADYFKEDNMIDIVNHYEKNKEVILNKKLKDSFSLLRHLELLLKKEGTHYLMNKNSFKRIINEYYPFLKKKLKKEMKELSSNFSFVHFLINEYFIPFNSISKYIQDSYTLLEIDTKEEVLINALQETSSYKQLKQFIPAANKETLFLLNNLQLNFFEKEKSPVNVRNQSHLELSILKVFNTTEKLNEFIKESGFYLVDVKLDFVRISISEINLITSIKNDLPRFFNSEKQFENALIKQIKKYTDIVIKNEKNEPFYNTPYDMLYNSLLNVISLYHHALEMKNRFIENGNKESEQLLNVYLNQNYSDFDEIHTKLTDIIQQIQYNPDAIFDIKPFKLLKNDVFEISQVTNARDLRRLGIEMNHCVVSYQPDIEDNKTVIFQLVNKITKAKELCIEYKVSSNEIVQAKKNENKIEYNNEILNYLSSFAKLNNYEINTNDLSSIRTI